MFSARSDAATLAQLTTKDPMMRLAPQTPQTLEALSQDPAIRRLAQLRESENAFYEMDLAASRDEGRIEGHTQARIQVLIAQLEERFGPLAAAVRSHVQSASPVQLDAWLARILTARSLDGLFGR